MATTAKVPIFVRLGSMLTTPLMRAGVKLVGLGSYPMCLLTVRGRKSGQPRTVSIAIINRNGKRYLGAPFGEVDWVRNLRAAGEATLTRGRRSETVSAVELPAEEAALLLRDEVKAKNPFARYFGVTADSTLADFEGAVAHHPMFLLEGK